MKDVTEKEKEDSFLNINLSKIKKGYRIYASKQVPNRCLGGL